MKLKGLLRRNKSSRPSRGSRAQPEAPEDNRFQRNRTFTRQTDSPSARQMRHRTRRQRRRLLLILAILAVSVTVIAIMLASFTRSVQVVTSDTTIVKPIDSKRYQASFKDYLNHHPLQRFRFAVDFTNLTDHLKQDFPEVEAVKAADSERIGVSQFYVKFRHPVARWKIEDHTYFVDTSGVIFQKNYFDIPAVEVVDHTRSFTSSAGAVASQRTLSFIGQVVAKVEAEDISIKRAEIPPGALRMIYLDIKNGPQARLTVGRAVDYQAANLVKATKYIKQKKLNPKYIDVRTEGKVFYK